MKVINGNNIDVLKQSISKYYIVTKEAEVINRKTQRALKFYPDTKGYLKARIYCDISKHKDNRIPIRLHRLVSLFHLPNFNSDLQVNHKDGNKLNNHISNLEMVTNSENTKHAWNYLDKDNSRRKSLIRNERGVFIKRNK